MTAFNDPTQVATVDDDGQIVWDRPADQLRNAAERQYTLVRNNPGLMPDARLALFADICTKLKAEMADLEARSGVQSAADLASLKRAAFGLDDMLRSASAADQAAIQLSFRDAQARAAQIETEDQAREMLNDAEQTGDELLARAVGNVCLTGGLFGFTEVAADYLAARPAKAEAVAALQAASRPLAISVMWEYVVAMPSELSAVPPGSIPLLASNAAAVRASMVAIGGTS